MTCGSKKLSCVSKKEFISKYRSKVTLLSSNSDYELVPVFPWKPTALIKIFQKPALVFGDDVVERRSEQTREYHGVL